MQDDDVSLAAPDCVFAAKAVSSEAELQNIVRALCRAKVVVFDATDFEPAIMFLVGIRAVLRRGVTLLSVGGTYALGKQLAVPFNVTDANIVAYSSAQKGAVELLAKRIRRGLDEMLSPQYFDLPVYDAIRSLPAERRGIIPSEEGVLVLCPFNESYGTFWEKNLKEALETELNTLRKNRKLPGTPNFGISRSFELDSPRLVTKAVFEHIRRVQSCVIDLTDWSPNVLFELGVRLAASAERTACIIEKSWEQRTREHWKSQCRNLVSMFVPENFRYTGSKSWMGQSAFRSAYGRDALPVAPLLNGWVHALVERTFDVESEPASRPVYVELQDQAALFSRDPARGQEQTGGSLPGESGTLAA